MQKLTKTQVERLGSITNGMTYHAVVNAIGAKATEALEKKGAIEFILNPDGIGSKVRIKGGQ